jgi:hypothetical protein
VFPKRRGILKEYIAPLGRVKKKTTIPTKKQHSLEAEDL